MMGWMVRNFILSEINVVLKIYKSFKRSYIEYCTQAGAPVSKHRNWCVILRLEDIQRRVTNVMKREKDYSGKKRLEELVWFGLV